jgi:hypothetical protein
MAVGRVSLDDRGMSTSSLGWMGLFEPSAPQTIWIARLEITSFTFMLVWVPEHVCQT